MLMGFLHLIWGTGFKKIAAFFFILLVVNTAYGQDILYKKDGSKDSVKVISVFDREVVYKKHKRPNGPLYREYLSRILLMRYENGTTEKTNKTKKAENNIVVKKKYDSSKLGRNIVSYNTLNPFFGYLDLGYERISKNGLIGLKLCAKYKIGHSQAEIFGYRRDFTTGFDVNFYPEGQGKIKFFLGPSFRLGSFRKTYDVFRTGAYMEGITDEFSYLGLLFNGGINLQASHQLYVGFQGALGFGRFTRKVDSETNIEWDGIFAVNLGYRF